MNDQVWIATSEGFFDLRIVHPILFILLFRGSLAISEALTGSAMLGYVVYTFAQMLLLAAVAAYLTAWLRSKNVRRGVILLLGAYFALTPIIADYSITAIKDVPFTAFLLLLVPCVYDIAATRGQWLENVRHGMLFLVSMFGLSIMRNNGIYILIALTIVLLFYIRSHRKLIAVFLSVVVCSQILLNSVSNNYPSESYAVMIQQVGAVIAEGGDISAEQLAVLDEIMSIQDWQNLYNFRSADPIKWSDDFNAHWFYNNSKRFIHIWLELLPDNFGIYCRSYLLLSLGCWDTDLSFDASYGPSQSTFFKLINNADGLDDKYGAIGLHSLQVFPDGLQSGLDSFYRKTVNYFGTGTCFWLLLLLAVLSVYKKDRALLLAMLPVFMNWLTLMVAISCSTVFRYSFPFVLSLPVFVILLISPLRARNPASFEKDHDHE